MRLYVLKIVLEDGYGKVVI